MNDRHILLTRDTDHQVIHDLWPSLPPPVSDRAEDLVRRDNAAMAEGASLLPADPRSRAGLQVRRGLCVRHGLPAAGQ